MLWVTVITLWLRQKEFYEQLKRNNHEKDFSNHPARYALAEIVNLHSPALQFEAIHRIITDTDTDMLIKTMNNELQISEKQSEQSFMYIVNGKEHTAYIHNPNLQPYSWKLTKSFLTAI